MKKSILLLIFILLSGCASQSLIVNQGQHGFPGELSEEYNIYQLENVEAENKSFLGFTTLNNHNDANIINFFGSSNKSKGISNVYKNVISAFNILSLSFIGSQILSSEESDGVFLGAFAGILFGGIFNEIAFNHRTKVNASLIASRKLIEENPNIDLFFYPKYNITSKQYLLSSKSKISLNSKGAVLKNELVKNKENYNAENFFKRHKEYEILEGEKEYEILEEEKEYEILEEEKEFNNLICSCNKMLNNSSFSPAKSVRIKCQQLFKNMKISTENGKKQFLDTVKRLDCK